MDQDDYNRKTVHPTDETEKYGNSAVTIVNTKSSETLFGAILTKQCFLRCKNRGS